jgi:predicted MFS family arabinose efflux permease
MKKHLFLFACSFFFALGHNILNFSMIYRLIDSFSFSPGQIGAYIAFGQIFYFLGCTLYHRFGSTVNPAKILPFATTAVFLASIPLGFIRTLGSVYTSYWLLMLSSSFFWPSIIAWLTEELSGNELSRKISYFNRSWMAALIFAPPIAGFLYRWNSNSNFIVISLSFSFTILLIFLARRYSPTQDGEKENLNNPAASYNTEKHQPSPLQQNKMLDLYRLYRYTAWICFFCSVMFAGVLANIVPIHIRDGLGYTESTAGMVLFSRCIAGFIGFIILAKFTVWHFNFRWLIILQAGLALCTLFFVMAGSLIHFYFAIVIFYGLVNSACTTNSYFYSSATGKSPKKNLALNEMFLCAGNAVGTAGGGLIYQHFGFTGTFLALMLVLITGLGILVLINRNNR